jgi:predicted SnoaL-like aldol condensation-catalyzing enzyme
MRPIRLFRKLFGLILAVAVLLGAATPALADNTATEAANKQLVLDFYQALNAADVAGAMPARIQAIAQKYLAPDYVQHSTAFADLPGPGTARDRLIRMFQTRPAMKPLPPATTLALMAEGDRVMMLTARAMPDPATGRDKQAYIFNMFRVRNGQLVEHWDITPIMPPPGH